GAHLELPDAAIAQAGALQRTEPGPLRPRRRELYALHLADSTLPGPDRASRAGRAPGPEGIRRADAGDRTIVLRFGTPRRRSRARTGRMEKGQVHGRSSGR